MWGNGCFSGKESEFDGTMFNSLSFLSFLTLLVLDILPLYNHAQIQPSADLISQADQPDNLAFSQDVVHAGFQHQAIIYTSPGCCTLISGLYLSSVIVLPASTLLFLFEM